MFYMYELFDKHTMEVFYVRKGNGDRVLIHQRRGYNPNINHI